MSADPTIRFVLEISVSDIERFKELVTTCVEISNAEPGTLMYHWYVDEASSTARLVEAYASVDAVLTHARGAVFTEVGPELLKVCTFVKMDAFGDVGKLKDGPSFWPTTYWGEPFAALQPR
jgi:quinol monooxygenase YgiN